MIIALYKQEINWYIYHTIKCGGITLEGKKRIALPKETKIEMMKFFMRTSVPRMIKNK